VGKYREASKDAFCAWIHSQQLYSFIPRTGLNYGFGRVLQDALQGTKRRHDLFHGNDAQRSNVTAKHGTKTYFKPVQALF
jgi:hypothetical protein